MDTIQDWSQQELCERVGAAFRLIPQDDDAYAQLRARLDEFRFAMRWSSSRAEMDELAKSCLAAVRDGILTLDRGSTWERRLASLLTRAVKSESHETLGLRLAAIRGFLPKDERYETLRARMKRIEFRGRYGIGPKEGLGELRDDMRMYVAEEDYGSPWELQVANIMRLSPQEVTLKYGNNVVSAQENVPV